MQKRIVPTELKHHNDCQKASALSGRKIRRERCARKSLVLTQDERLLLAQHTPLVSMTERKYTMSNKSKIQHGNKKPKITKKDPVCSKKKQQAENPKVDWLLKFSNDEQVKAVTLMNEAIEEMPIGTDESGILNEIKMRLRVEEFERMLENYKMLSPDILKAKSEIVQIEAKGYDPREVNITNGIFCLAYAASGGVAAKMQKLGSTLLHELDDRLEKRLRQYKVTIKAVVALNHDVMTEEQMKKRVDMFCSLGSIDINTKRLIDIMAALEHIRDNGETVLTSLNSVQRRLTGLRSNGKVGKRIGRDEQIKIYNIWKEGKETIHAYKRKTSKPDVWENATYQRKLRDLGVNNCADFEGAINAYEKNHAKEKKLKKTRSRG